MLIEKAAGGAKILIFVYKLRYLLYSLRFLYALKFNPFFD